MTNPKPINNWNSLYNSILEKYQVTKEGRIIGTKGNLLSKGRMRMGYERKNFHLNGKPVTIRIHRLVAYMYIKNDNPKFYNTVDHIDASRKWDNSVSNLQWMNYLENIKKGNKPQTCKCGKPIFDKKWSKYVNKKRVCNSCFIGEN